MSSKRPRSKNEPTRSALTAADRGRLLIWVACLTGLLFGLSMVLFQLHLVRSSIARERDNSLLVSQQLDELFRATEKQILQDNSQLGRFVDTLRVFYVYDRKFVQLNDGNPLTTSESANASHRLAQCALLFGDYDQSKVHYRRVKEQLSESISKAPETRELVIRLLIDAISKIAVLEKYSGNEDSSQRELREAIGLVEGLSSMGVADPSVLRDLATLCSDYGFGVEAKWLAQRIEREESGDASPPQDERSSVLADEVNDRSRELAP